MKFENLKSPSILNAFHFKNNKNMVVNIIDNESQMKGILWDKHNSQEKKFKKNWLKEKYKGSFLNFSCYKRNYSMIIFQLSIIYKTIT